MNYRAIVACALIMGVMHQSRAMDNAVKDDSHERDKLMVRGKFWGLSSTDLEGSNNEIAARIEAKSKEVIQRNPSSKKLEEIHLKNEGFRGQASPPIALHAIMNLQNGTGSNHNGD